MGKPAIRRLVDAVKKRNRKKNLFDKVSAVTRSYLVVFGTKTRERTIRARTDTIR